MYFFDDFKIHEECGIFGIYNCHDEDSAQSVYFGLYALQHRGQESVGIAVSKNRETTCRKSVGLVSDLFNAQLFEEMKGNIAVGHVRYSTSGSKSIENAGPIVSRYIKGSISIAHNGNITNATQIRRELEENGAIFHSDVDSEIISYVLAKCRIQTKSIEEAAALIMDKLEGAYSLIIMSPNKLIALRDKNGFRPLCIGKRGDSYIFASESCAIEAAGGKFVRDILPGEVVTVENGKLSSKLTTNSKTENLCVFEMIYFARPDSVINGIPVYEARKRAGSILSFKYPVGADIVIGVPDSGTAAAIGYSQTSGIPYGEGFIKNKYIGRTFISPTQKQRENSVQIKLNVLKTAVESKRVILVDDSIVRGTTSKKIISLLREAGAMEIHLRISAPPFKYPCYFGTDIPEPDLLIANKMTLPEIKDYLGVDSIGYLDVEDLKSMNFMKETDFCKGCFTGVYPTKPQD